MRRLLGAFLAAALAAQPAFAGLDGEKTSPSQSSQPAPLDLRLPQTLSLQTLSLDPRAPAPLTLGPAPAAAALAPIAAAAAAPSAAEKIAAATSGWPARMRNVAQSARSLWSDLKAWTGPDDLSAPTVTPPLIQSRLAHEATWREKMRRTPEAANGLSTEQALSLLETLKGSRDPAQGGQHVRNDTHFVSLPDGQQAVVKRNYTRSELGDSKVYHTTNDVRMDVLAFRLDRYLGTNMVPPAVMLDRQTEAQLRVGGASRNWRSLKDDEGLRLEAANLNILDALLGNPDRANSENVLLGPGGKLVGIDFDLAKIDGMVVVEAIEWRLFQRALVHPGRRIGRLGRVPALFSKSVVERLRSLDQPALRAMAAEGEISLSDSEIHRLLAQRDGLLHVVDQWRRRYGDDVILVDASKP